MQKKKEHDVTISNSLVRLFLAHQAPLNKGKKKGGKFRTDPRQFLIGQELSQVKVRHDQ